LLTGLTASTGYLYDIQTFDALGNSVTAAGLSFTTMTPMPQVLFSDGFEGGNLTDGGWTISGSASVGSAGAFSGGYGAIIKKTAWIQKALSTAGLKDNHVQYARKTAGLDAGEYLYVEWSADGTVWNSLETTTATSWETRNLLCGSGAENQVDFRLRFRTNANRTDEYGYVDAVVLIGTPRGPINQEPSVTITQPTNGAVFALGDPITFTATAVDTEDGNLTADIVWQSSIDGQIGTSGTVSTSSLSQGNHTITATVADSGSVSGSASISITVGIVSQTLHAESVSMSLTKINKNWRATATVFVNDQADLPKSGATVTGNWYLNTTLIQTGATGVTGANGSVAISSPNKTAQTGDTFRFVISNIVLAGYEYNPAQGVTEGSIQVQ
jgi:hypothetical protein